MRRAIFALLGTATGTVLLVGAKGGFSHPASAGPSDASGTVPVADEHRPSSSAAPSAVTGPTKAAPTSSPTKKAAPTRSTPAKPGNGGGGLRTGTWNGDPEFNEFGNVELAIVVSGGKITDVRVLDFPRDHSRSAQINNRALPRLRSEALAAQSASIDTVSGATVTSESYRQSLQAAIDRAHG